MPAFAACCSSLPGLVSIFGVPNAPALVRKGQLEPPNLLELRLSPPGSTQCSTWVFWERQGQLPAPGRGDALGRGAVARIRGSVPSPRACSRSARGYAITGAGSSCASPAVKPGGAITGCWCQDLGRRLCGVADVVEDGARGLARGSPGKQAAGWGQPRASGLWLQPPAPSRVCSCFFPRGRGKDGGQEGRGWRRPHPFGSGTAATWKGSSVEGALWEVEGLGFVVFVPCQGCVVAQITP